MDEEKSLIAVLSLDDPRWNGLKGGYCTLCDPRPLLIRIEADTDTESMWHELWGELYHQGDVGEASYAAVPHLVRHHRRRGAPEWNTYAITAMIELARGQRRNPEPPKWIEDSYFSALRELAEMGIRELPDAKNSEDARAILSVIALQKGARTHARFLVEYSEEELLEIESAASEKEL